MPCKRRAGSQFLTKILSFASAPRTESKVLEERLKNGPEKKAVDAFETEMLSKLSAGKIEQAKGKEYTKADLRLELKLKKQRLFYGEPSSRSMPNCSRMRRGRATRKNRRRWMRSRSRRWRN